MGNWGSGTGVGVWVWRGTEGGGISIPGEMRWVVYKPRKEWVRSAGFHNVLYCVVKVK